MSRNSNRTGDLKTSQSDVVAVLGRHRGKRLGQRDGTYSVIEVG